MQVNKLTFTEEVELVKRFLVGLGRIAYSLKYDEK